MPKILVVDDDLDILVVMEILLIMKRFEVDVTAKWKIFLIKLKVLNLILFCLMCWFQVTMEEFYASS